MSLLNTPPVHNQTPSSAPLHTHPDNHQAEAASNEIAASPVTLTDSAAKQVRYLMQKKGGDNLFLRVGVKGGGCSGLSYFLNLETEARDIDLHFQSEGLNLIVDAKSAKFIAGTTLDYSVKNLLEGGWVFQNPNAGRTCGCGTSFQPKTN